MECDVRTMILGLELRSDRQTETGAKAGACSAT